MNRGSQSGKQARVAVVTLIIAAAGIALGQSSVEEVEAPDVTIVLDNVQAEAWVVSAVEGADVEATEVAKLGVEDAVIHLEVGKRYRFVNRGTLTIHPFAIRGVDGEVLLGQRPKDRPFEIDPSVAFVADAEGVTFTLTESLAEVVDTYYCTAHPAPLMESGIEIVNYAE